MLPINARTLALVIQAIEFRIDHLEQELAARPLDAGTDLEDLLLSYTNAARTLEQVYREARSHVANLPAYMELVARTR